MANIEIKRGYEVLPDNNVRFGIRIANTGDVVISDVEVILDYSESLFKLEGERVQKIGNIPPASTRTAEFVLKPLGCVHRVNIEALISYRDIKYARQRVDMQPKEVHCVCPFLKGKAMPRAEFLELSSSGYSAAIGLNFKGVSVERLTSYLVQTCKNRHYKVNDFLVDGGRMLYLASESIGEKAYYLLTALIKEDDGLTQVMLKVASDKPHGLNGYLNETVVELRHVVSTVQLAQEIGIIKKEQVINIIDSLVQRTSFGWGEGGASVNIVGNLIQRANINLDEDSRVEGERLRKSKENSIGMKFTHVPAGEFMMGSRKWNDNEQPVHKVTISKPFYLGTYPVTQREWKAVMGNKPSHFKGDNLPVENVSWDDVQEFIRKLNEKERTDKYRLPSEAEWEYACRAGTITEYYHGDSESKLGEYAWYDNNSDDKTHPVGQKKPNFWNLYDMHGNVWEWVQDKWHSNYDGAPMDGSAWESEDGSSRVFCGGCWLNNAGFSRSAYHLSDEAGLRHYNLGFRLLQEHPGKNQNSRKIVELPYLDEKILNEIKQYKKHYFEIPRKKGKLLKFLKPNKLTVGIDPNLVKLVQEGPTKTRKWIWKSKKTNKNIWVKGCNKKPKVVIVKQRVFADTPIGGITPCIDIIGEETIFEEECELAFGPVNGLALSNDLMKFINDPEINALEYEMGERELHLRLEKNFIEILIRQFEIED